jgi:hypothetical protein
LIQEVRDHFQDVIDSLESQLENRAQLRDKKVECVGKRVLNVVLIIILLQSILKLLLNIHNSVTKVEDLLGINSDITKSSFNNAENDEMVVVDDK